MGIVALILTVNSNHPALQAFTLCISASECSLHLCLAAGGGCYLIICLYLKLSTNQAFPPFA